MLVFRGGPVLGDYSGRRRPIGMSGAPLQASGCRGQAKSVNRRTQTDYGSRHQEFKRMAGITRRLAPTKHAPGAEP